MRTLIVEDEPKNIKLLKKFLKDFSPKVNVIGEATNIQRAKEIYHSLQPELLILDIQLTTESVFDFLDDIMPVTCEIIFITAYDGFALKAFKYSAIDYLLKPVNIEELKSAIEKAEKNLGHKNVNFQLKQLVENFNKPFIHKIALPMDTEFRFIDIDEIMYCIARGHQTAVYTSSKQLLITSRPIGEYEELLPRELFFRVHNSFLINMNFITKYFKGRGGVVEMKDGTKIEVAARRKEEFLARFDN